jgi:membrane fusion protein, multidrug efflux system
MSRHLSIIFALAVLAACSRATSEAEKSERPAVAVEVSRVAAGNVKESIAVVGTLTPKFFSDVKTEYSGTITDVYVTEWVKVSRGTLLARFDRREADASLQSAIAARMQAEVGATRARRELERSEKLKGAGLATQQNLDDARSAADAADAQLNAAKAHEEMAKTRVAKTEVRAPMDGTIASRTVNPGDFIENMGSPKPMFRIVDNTRLELTVTVPSSQIASVHLGEPLTFTTDAVQGRTFEGRVSFINPAADESSRTVKVVALVPNNDGALRSGLFARGEIVINERPNVLRVPRSAMLTWDPATKAGIVYVVNGDRAQRRNVSTGAAGSDTIEIAGGVRSGDVVVTRGAFNLRDGDRVSVVANPGA